MNQPTEQIRSGHVPAALLPPGIDPRAVQVVIVAPVEHRLSVSPVALLTVACGSVGLAAALYLATQLAIAAVPFAGVGIGVTVKLARKRKS